MYRKMQRTTKSAVRYCGPLFALIFFCEFLIYYLVLFRCSYPALEAGGEADEGRAVRAMFLADTHLLGSRLGHWFDKLRREWQMHRAFQTAQTYFRPDLVVFLGDVFDEGKWCPEDEFSAYVLRFSSLFHVSPGTKVRVVAGNHDVGFHYALTPRLEARFEAAFGTPPVDLFTLKDGKITSKRAFRKQRPPIAA